jgi:pimeloyl-ACP methyl ester carboxylesterase
MTRDEQALGHERVGTGPRAVVVLNDWMCDTSTWDGARAYLDRERFSWAFVDLRGYGRSRGRAGSFTVLEAAGDVIRSADALEWSRFSIVGHSMSTLVALHLAQSMASRVDRVVLLTPPPPRGFGADDAQLEATRILARGDDAMRFGALAARFAGRLSRGWAADKAARWRASADPEAVATYAAMFMRDGLPDPGTRVAIPVLAITGEHDTPPMRREAVARHLSPLCADLQVMGLAECGHYPMQEMPPLTVALVERFLGVEA